MASPSDLVVSGAAHAWVLPASRALWRQRQDVVGAVEKLRAFLLGRKIRLACTGMPGVGKTVLLDHITGRASQTGYKPPGVSHAVEKRDLSLEGRRVAFSIVPGQDSPQRHDALDAAFDPKALPDGVIHVVSNGYVTLRSEEARRLEAVAWPSLDAFLAVRRQQEVADLDLVCTRLNAVLRRNHKPSWLLVALTKVDLFQEDLAQAEAWYGPDADSPFADRLRRLQGKIGSDRFQWSVAPVCAWPEDFDFGDFTVVSGFKSPERDHYLTTFLEVLDGLSQREIREASP